MTELDLAAIKARAEAATEGPWEAYSMPAYRNEPGYLGVAVGDSELRVIRDAGGWHDANFIANARQDIPALLAYIEELEAQVERVRLKAKVEAFMDAQQIIAGEDPIDEMRHHDGSKVSIGHTIREIDVEIRELALGGDDE